ncbi:hypothetical protein [Legionella micdadei]|nr:hypothetical protein [Legionella micdadei]NSL17656.1 hypothetical protein [Legionella micdadei]
MMNVDLSNINATLLSSPKIMDENKAVSNQAVSADPATDSSETGQIFNEATQLLQTITTKLSGAVIRKISPSEYAQLMMVLEQIIRNSINDRV